MTPRIRAAGLAALVILAHASVATAQPAWLDHVHAYRRSAGLPLLTENPTWSDGDQKHAVYTVKNGVLGHSENASLPYYTPEGHAA